MALRDVDPDKPPRHVGRAAKKVGDAAKKGKVVGLDNKPLRPGQRHRGRAKKARRVLKDPVEATEVSALADKMIGADVWGLRNITNIKTLYLFVENEKLGGGCIDGTIKVTRYPHTMRWKPGLKFQILVVISSPKWGRTTDEEKTRILFHGLRHFWSDSEGTLRMQVHEFAGFYAEVERFHLKAPEIRKIAEQLQLAGVG